jgi:cell division protein FtsB
MYFRRRYMSMKKSVISKTIKLFVCAFVFMMAVTIIGTVGVKAAKKKLTKKDIEQNIEALDKEIAELKEKADTSEKAAKKLKDKKGKRDLYQAALDATLSLAEDGNDEYTVKKGQKIKPAFTVSEKKYNKLIWSTSSSKIVKIGKKGYVKAVGYGTAEITVKTSISEDEISFMVYVCKPVKKIKADADVYINPNIYMNKTYTIPFSIKPADATYSVKVADDGVAELAEDECKPGSIAIKILSKGKTTVDIYDYTETLIQSINVIVYEPLTSLEFEKSEYTVTEFGGVVDLKFKDLASDYTDPIKLNYVDEGDVEITDMTHEEEGCFRVIFFGDDPLVITAVSDSGATDTCQITPSYTIDPNDIIHDDDDDDESLSGFGSGSGTGSSDDDD